MKIIHIAPNIDYLFPATAATARTLCNRLIQDVFTVGEFVGTANNLNEKCEVCVDCKHKLERV